MDGNLTLAERLGYPVDTRILIINCDDLGSSNSANIGIEQCFNQKVVTTATLMVPCPWANGGVKVAKGRDVGVHLTLNAEWDDYRWSPLTKGKSLLTQGGGFHKSVPELYDNAELDEVEEELRAQINQAIDWGVDVTHLDSHMGPLHLREDYFKLYLQMAVEFNLPLRMPNAEHQELLGFNYRSMAEDKGIIFPDFFAFVFDGVGSRSTVVQALSNINFGVTEVYFHPAVNSKELRSMADDYEKRLDDFKMLTEDKIIQTKLEELDIKLIGYRQLRDLMRSEG
jgi:predicted glycoside hydrolase/deacetylase ChbG (UPF0249 family)